MEILSTEELIGALFQCKSAMVGDTHGIPAVIVEALLGEGCFRNARTVIHKEFYLRDMGGYSLLYITRNGFRILANARYCTAPLQQAAQQDMIKAPTLPSKCVVLYNWYLWHNSFDRQAGWCLRRYCKYIANHGYPGSAETAWNALSRLDRDNGTAWILITYGLYTCGRKV